MKITVCKTCAGKLFSVFYAPRFCRRCGKSDLKSVSLVEWFALAIILVLIGFYFFKML